ncbi:hypothetical protein [Gilliamella sp. B2911]|uniref:hypothetical protein n=1 Tax=Gilliamella sp. B2911 TaxID=2817980 RepID=UPI00226AD1F9|nr:hypothetical protein [Gilliamella sp. B2911]MCX8662508.1 hypothetical protein [Gilliamella sp. B2911]
MLQSLSNKDAQILVNTENLPHGKWGNKVDLNYAGKLADTLEHGGFKDFPVNADSVRNNGDSTFHGFPIDCTAEPIAQGKEAKLRSTCH